MALPPFCRPGVATTGAADFCQRVSPPDCYYYRRILVLIQSTFCTKIGLSSCVFYALVIVLFLSYNNCDKEVRDLPLKYKIDVLAALKAAGYTTYRIRQDNLLSQSTLQKLREGVGVSWDNIETLCRLLRCQPGDIIEYMEDGPDGD